MATGQLAADVSAVSEPPHAPVQASSSAWPSGQPIVIGRPIPRFEPKSVGPEFRSNPYRPDTILDGWSTDAFAVRGASTRGYWHRHVGSPRQDDFALLLRHDVNRLVIAVADGVSEAPQSHLGATLSVRYATQWIAANAHDRSLADIDWKALVESTAWALVEHAASIFGQDTVDATEAERVFATTLVCAVVEPGPSGELSAAIIAVGDSAAWVLSADGYRALGGGKSEVEGGLSSSAVSGLPRVPTHIDVATVTVHAEEVLLLGTDGFGDPLGSGEGEVGRLFSSTLGSYVPSITQFGHMLDFSRETFDDDRTLVAVWPGGVGAKGT